MVAEHEVVRQEVDTQLQTKQSMVNSEIAQAQKQFKADIDQFEAKMAEHKRQIQDLTSPSSSWEQSSSSSNHACSRLTRRVGTAQNELLKSQIANAVLVERVNLDLLKWAQLMGLEPTTSAVTGRCSN